MIKHMGHDPRARGKSEKQRAKADQAASRHNEFEPHPADTIGNQILQLRPAQAQLLHHAPLMRFLAIDHELLVGLTQRAIDFLLYDLGSRDAELKALAAHVFNEHREM